MLKDNGEELTLSDGPRSTASEEADPTSGSAVSLAARGLSMAIGELADRSGCGSSDMTRNVCEVG